MRAGCKNEFERHHLSAILAQQFLPLSRNVKGQLRGLSRRIRFRGKQECSDKRNASKRSNDFLHGWSSRQQCTLAETLRGDALRRSQSLESLNPSMLNTVAPDKRTRKYP